MADSWTQIDDDGVVMDWDTLSMPDIWHPLEACRRALVERQTAANFYGNTFDFDILKTTIPKLADIYSVVDALKTAANTINGYSGIGGPVYGRHDDNVAQPTWNKLYYPPILGFTFTRFSPLSLMWSEFYTAINKMRCIHLRWQAGTMDYNQQQNMYDGTGWFPSGKEGSITDGDAPFAYIYNGGKQRNRLWPKFTAFSVYPYKYQMYAVIRNFVSMQFNDQGDRDFNGNLLEASYGTYVLLYEENSQDEMFQVSTPILNNDTDPTTPDGGWQCYGHGYLVSFQQIDFNFRNW